MKIYTGTGDLGKTSLFSGERLSKSNQRIEAFGDIDELNSVIGALRASLEPEKTDIATPLHHIQTHLFSLASWLATTLESPSAGFLDKLTEEPSKKLEHAIDCMEKNLPALKGFIIPGGTISAAWAHIARTICRRTERQVIRIIENEGNAFLNDNNKLIIAYLNRLSDYFFVLARYLNHLSGIKDLPWKK